MPVRTPVDPPAAELLPNDVTCAKETRDLIIECCVGEGELLRSLRAHAG